MTTQEKRSAMFSMVEQWQKSGLSQREFAQVQNMPLVRLRYWIKKTRQCRDAEHAFIPLNGFAHQEISIRYPNGIELTLPVQTPAGVLKSLINL